MRVCGLCLLRDPDIPDREMPAASPSTLRNCRGIDCLFRRAQCRHPPCTGCAGGGPFRGMGVALASTMSRGVSIPARTWLRTTGSGVLRPRSFPLSSSWSDVYLITVPSRPLSRAGTGFHSIFRSFFSWRILGCALLVLSVSPLQRAGTRSRQDESPRSLPDFRACPEVRNRDRQRIRRLKEMPL